MFRTLFSTMQLDRDNRIEELEQKVTSIQNTNVDLEDEISDIKKTTEHKFSVLCDEISSFESKIKSHKTSNQHTSTAYL